MQNGCFSRRVENQHVTTEELKPFRHHRERPLDHEVRSTAYTDQENKTLIAVVDMRGEATVWSFILDGRHGQRFELTQIEAMHDVLIL